ncbi:MAG: DinB family protein [Acidobacteria bacterium]|nr:DinB family protein [Acidobacteriota bacterium]
MGTLFLDESLAILARVPAALDALLRDLPEAWTEANEGPGTWSPREVIGHLIHLEKVDWMPRLDIILQYGPGRPFDPVDREAQLRERDGKPLAVMLDELSTLRGENLKRLRALNLGDEQLDLEGRHPALGVVTARQLLATWAAHDLAHLVQIGRVMAKRYRHETGPWAEYLTVMH